MEVEHLQSQISIKEDVYWRVWQTEQEHLKVRWNNATFFISISFAILGFSFQDHLSPSAALAVRVSGLVIYWFAYALFLYFHRYTLLLRSYLRDMEVSGDVTFTFQAKTDATMRPDNILKRTQSTWLLFYFGLLYTAGIILLSWLGL